MAELAVAAAEQTTPPSTWALGVDLGGTKTEAILLNAAGCEHWRQRIDTPAAQGYDAILGALVALVQQGRAACAAAGTASDRQTAGPSIGIGTPGTVTADGRMKNANTTCLNGRPLADDLMRALGQPVRLANDANCLALSEATDGAGAGAPVVFSAILGTGTGAGIAVHGQVISGPNGLAGEWGHNPMPWLPEDAAHPACYCGQRGCVETWLSGPGMAGDHLRRNGLMATAKQIAAAADSGDAACADTVARWHQHLARALAQVINLLDPDVIVLGGGLSRIASTYARVPQLWGQWVIGARDEPLRTRLAPALHGDASGVRGAAWLWRGVRSAMR